jgi:hypothetical protein
MSTVSQSLQREAVGMPLVPILKRGAPATVAGAPTGASSVGQSAGMKLRLPS